jgi:hypothetical protein
MSIDACAKHLVFSVLAPLFFSFMVYNILFGNMHIPYGIPKDFVVTTMED